VTFGEGKNEPEDMSKSFVGFAKSCDFKDRILELGLLAMYFSATSFCIMK
jgi:hypothetical protein